MSARVELPPVPPWLAALPFICAPGSGRDADLVVGSALASAAAALAADSERRDSRSRICFLLAELAAQYARRTGDHSGQIPVGRGELARAAQISLPRVKRILGFLILSGTIELCDGGICVRDWKRLCTLGSYDRSWLCLPLVEEDEKDRVPPDVARASPPAVTTAAGDPASFV